MLNIISRTQGEQETVERELTARGSLWPRFDILHHYVFSADEFEAVKAARRTLARFQQKVDLVSAHTPEEESTK